MAGRLILAIISTILEEAAIVVVVLWGLPQLDIEIPLWAMVVIMVIWAAYSIFTFQMGTRALKRGRIVGLPDMIGTEGIVISALSPEGLVRIKSELWVAKSAGAEIEPGVEVTVVEQERLKVVVRESGAAESRNGTG